MSLKLIGKTIFKRLQYFLPLDVGEVYSNTLSEHHSEIDIVLLVASHKRQSSLLKLLRYFHELKDQRLNVASVVCLSSGQELDFFKSVSKDFQNLILVKCENKPIGNKWQVALNHAKLMNAKSYLVVGSDDLVSHDYLLRAYDLVVNKSITDLYGTDSWFIKSIDNGLYHAKYNEGCPPYGSNLVGAGRLYSKKFLDRIQWKLFNRYFDSGLDHQGLSKVKELSKLGFYRDDSGGFVLSIKGDWETLNSFEVLKHSKRIKLTKIDHGSEYYEKLLELCE